MRWYAPRKFWNICPVEHRNVSEDLNQRLHCCKYLKSLRFIAFQHNSTLCWQIFLKFLEMVCVILKINPNRVIATILLNWINVGICFSFLHRLLKNTKFRSGCWLFSSHRYKSHEWSRKIAETTNLYFYIYRLVCWGSTNMLYVAIKINSSSIVWNRVFFALSLV